MPGITAHQALISVLLNEPVYDVVQRLRSRGYSWQAVADQIALDTNGAITLNRETYRLWYATDPAMSVTA